MLDKYTNQWYNINIIKERKEVIKMRTVMDKEFSDGFMQDIADLLEFCLETKQDNLELVFGVDDNTLKINIAFEVH